MYYLNFRNHTDLEREKGPCFLPINPRNWSVLPGVSTYLHKRPQISGFVQVFLVHFEFDLQQGQKFQTIIQVTYAWQGL